jgi:hypothetical protein
MPYAPGTCRGCGKVCDGVRCAACKAERRKEEAARSAYRRAHGLCLVCAQPVAPTKLQAGGTKRVKEPARYCREHLAYYAARSRAG